MKILILISTLFILFSCTTNKVDIQERNEVNKGSQVKEDTIEKKDENIAQEEQTEKTENEISKENIINFSSEVSGDRKVAIDGEGYYNYVIGYEGRPGYHIIANTSGLRDYGITFVIPEGTKRGLHKITTNPSPFDIGKEVDVRVEIQDTVNYFNKNTVGEVVLQNDISSNVVEGSFSFATENKDGEKIDVIGNFQIKKD